MLAIPQRPITPLRDRIATGINYPVPDHRQPELRWLLPPELSLPATEKVGGEILTLPCFPEMTDAEVALICGSLARFCGRLAPPHRLTRVAQ
jgi:dTDP-4-amino-4,6-dideoxygalactose transaminase